MSRQRQTDTRTLAEDDRRYVTALARGLEVLRCFKPQDRWLSHFYWEGIRLGARTTLGRATIHALRLNRDLALAIRAEEVAAVEEKTKCGTPSATALSISERVAAVLLR